MPKAGRAGCRSLGYTYAPALVMIDTFSSRLPHPGTDGGFMLIEVIISALLVGLIAVGTYTGLASANRAGAARARERPGDRDRPAGRGAAAGADRQGTLRPRQHHPQGGRKRHVRRRSLRTRGATTAARPRPPAKRSRASRARPTPTPSSRSPPRRSSSPPPKTSSRAKSQTASRDYIQTTSSVNWPSIGKHSPVSQSSLVAVPTSRLAAGQGQEPRQRTCLGRKSRSVRSPDRPSRPKRPPRPRAA